MPRTKRSFTPEQRLSLIQEAEREGYMETCRKYNLSPTLLSRWKKKFQEKGAKGLEPGYRRIDPEVRALEEENERLKPILSCSTDKQRGQVDVQGVSRPIDSNKKSLPDTICELCY